LAAAGGTAAGQTPWPSGSSEDFLVGGVLIGGAIVGVLAFSYSYCFSIVGVLKVVKASDVRACVVGVHVGVLLSIVPAEEIQRDAGRGLLVPSVLEVSLQVRDSKELLGLAVFV
jgi:hypothetical protein